MPITSKPVDVVALRARWCEITTTFGDIKTQRIARQCCWENIARDLMRYVEHCRWDMLYNLFPDGTFAVELEHRLENQGPKAAAEWLEEELGVKL